MEREPDIDEEARGDELDDAIRGADDTGMIAQQQEIATEEVLLGQEGLLPEHGPLGDDNLTDDSADDEGKI